MLVKRISILSMIAIISLAVTLLIIAGVSSAEVNSDIKSKGIIIYYFHGDFRCHTCIRMEELTKKAVSDGFSKELSEGSVQLKIINIDKPENTHFVKEYNLNTRSVIISEFDGTNQVRWKNLPKIWDYVRFENTFIKYIQDEVKEYL